MCFTIQCEVVMITWGLMGHLKSSIIHYALQAASVNILQYIVFLCAVLPVLPLTMFSVLSTMLYKPLDVKALQLRTFTSTSKSTSTNVHRQRQTVKSSNKIYSSIDPLKHNAHKEQQNTQCNKCRIVERWLVAFLGENSFNQSISSCPRHWFLIDTCHTEEENNILGNWNIWPCLHTGGRNLLIWSNNEKC